MPYTAKPSKDQRRYLLHSPVAMPRASSFLWNKEMMIHMNCRGYAVSQFMQPEPAKYAYAPNLEAKTFMQPEQPYYAHHPGRFVYFKDRSSGDLFSVPYEPVRRQLDSFVFSVGKSDVLWKIKNDELRVELKLTLSLEDTVELWTIQVTNESSKTKKISMYPYFTVGYMSWMNQSARFDDSINGIICSCISPYQKYQDYDKVKTYKDKTFLISDTPPKAFETIQENFEGEGGLHDPQALNTESLGKGESLYETPVCALQYDWDLAPGETKSLKLVFGPARTDEEIHVLSDKYFSDEKAFEKLSLAYAAYVEQGDTGLKIKTPNAKFDNFVNHWMSRQIFYHGETNRLSTDPQTRNYLQDNMGMSYINPEITRKAFVTALEQQESSGAMPDGVLIQEGAELKYINQVPHTDHCVWLPVCLRAYLDETNDYQLLSLELPFADSSKKSKISEHIDLAMRWLLNNRDERGLNYINQGDWCDPMNMVGYKGKGVSGWLSLATAYALQQWSNICKITGRKEQAKEFETGADLVNAAVNRHMWNGSWYSRGITDDGVAFGIPSDQEGSIFLNPQGWSLLSGAADKEKRARILQAVSERLETPFGVEMLAPSFTEMREDVGRVTQKHPGSAENGSVYNHAAAFYIYGLYEVGEKDKAYELLDKMLPGPEEKDLLQRGQLPVFIPNYYRGAYRQFERTAGRSSQLFNTGTISWFYRSLIDGLFGLRGEPNGLRVSPQLPTSWKGVEINREFRGALLKIKMQNDPNCSELQVYVDQKLLSGNLIQGIEAGQTICVEVKIPV